MAITANRQMTATWYTPPSQEGGDAPARFKVKPLTGAQSLEVHDDFDANRGRFMARGLRLAMRYGLVDWENVKDEQGKDLDCTAENFTYLPALIQSELGNHIIDLELLGAEEEKNSESP